MMFQNKRTTVTIAAAGLLVLAAGGAIAVSRGGSNTAPQAHAEAATRAPLLSTPGATPQPTVTAAPTRTPVPTSSPAPTATPRPTATPAPRWHLTGTFSGVGSETDFTHISGQVGDRANIRILWTCRPTASGPWQITFAIQSQDEGSNTCAPGNQQGSMLLSALSGKTFGVSAAAGTGDQWTASIYAWR